MFLHTKTTLDPCPEFCLAQTQKWGSLILLMFVLSYKTGECVLNPGGLAREVRVISAPGE